MAKSGKPAEFPTQQMIILAISRFAEPVAATSVYPYIPEMVASFNVPTDQIGVYSGWLAAVFSVSQAITGIAWGRASDRLGRKPMVLLALFLIMISSVLFGFSTSLTMAFVSRSMQGLSSGNIGIIRTAVAEMVPQKELQPRAFSVMPLVWNVGSVFGPSIGGFLSNPQRRGWFTGSELLKTFPYALPNLMISVLFLIGITSGILFLKETHADMKSRKDYGLLLGSMLTSSCSNRKNRQWKRNEEEADPFLGENGSPRVGPIALRSPKQPPSSIQTHTWKEVFTRQSVINLVAYTGLAMHSIAFDQLLPVFMHHPTESHESRDGHPLRFAGGFGLDSGRIGVLFTVYAVFGMTVQFVCFPPIARKFGVLNCLKVCAMVFPFAYVAIPFTSKLSTSNQKQGMALALMLVKCAAGIFAFPCSTILLTNSAKSLGVLGTLNGVATSISAAGRAAGPALVGWAFTFGVDTGYLVIPFWTLAVVSIISAIPVWWLVEMEGFSATTEADEEHELTSSERHEQDAPANNLHDAEVVRQTTGLGILAGTEAADLLDDDLPVITQSQSQLRSQTHGRPGIVGRRTSSTYSLRKTISPIDTGLSAASSGAMRRPSVFE